MIRALASESIRFKRTSRSALIAMVAIALLTSVLTIVGFDDGGGAGPGGGGAGLGAADLSAAGGNVAAMSFAGTLLGIAALAIFALSVARDYETGTIRLLFVGEPRRAIVMGGKLLALVATVAVGVAIATGVMALSGFALAPTAGVDTALWTTGDGWWAVWTTLVNTTGATIVWGLIGAALAMATRSAATSITAGVAYLMVGENLLSLVWDSASEWLPAGVLTAFSAGGTETVSYAQSSWLMAAYAAACLAVTFVVIERRDITD